MGQSVQSPRVGGWVGGWKKLTKDLVGLDAPPMDIIDARVVKVWAGQVWARRGQAGEGRRL